MPLRYGIPKVDPHKRICYNCQHFLVDIDPHSGWGICDIGKNDGMFLHHVKHPIRHCYMAKHTNGRYYNQTACKVRFKSVVEGE